MSNSDLIAAISLALTAIIFLKQTDDTILRLKIRKNEKFFLIFIMLGIIGLTNYNVFERFGAYYYFTICGKYLRPNEWAFLLFLYIICIILYRVFSKKIFNNSENSIFEIINKYRHEKKWLKLSSLLSQVMDLNNFTVSYANKLDETVFNDHHIIEHFANNYSDILIKFCTKYPDALLMQGENAYYILKGLFEDKSNPIFSEISQYYNEKPKSIFLREPSQLLIQDRGELIGNKYSSTHLPLISWLSSILNTTFSNFKYDVKTFLKQLPEAENFAETNNIIYKTAEMDILLSHNRIYNSLKLFRILLIEYAITKTDVNKRIGDPLFILYSSWEFIKENTKMSSSKISINNDAFTIPEYCLKFIFDSYFSIYFLLRYKGSVGFSKLEKEEDNSFLLIQQIFQKLNGVFGSENIISEKSIEYYFHFLFKIYFDAVDYFVDNDFEINELRNSILYYLKESLKHSSLNDVDIIIKNLNKSLDSFDFIDYSSKRYFESSKLFYTSLLPYTKPHAWKIVR